MKKKNLWLVIMFVLGILFTIGFLLSKIEIKDSSCSAFYNENCNKYCISNDDCKYVCGCGCIQADESCSLKKKLLFNDQEILLFCKESSCKCENQRCSVDVNSSQDYKL